MPDPARPWSGDPPPRHLTSCYDRLRQALRRPLEPGLHAAIAVMHQAAPREGAPVVERLFQGIQDKAGLGRARHPPADDPPGEGIDDKGDIDEPLPASSTYIAVIGDTRG